MHGQLAARYLIARALTAGDFDALRGFVDKAQWGTDGHLIKAAVAALGTGDVDNDPQRLVQADFLRVVRPATIVGRLLERRLVRVLPAETPVIRQTAGTSAHWIADGDAVPVGDATFTRDGRLHPKIVGAIAVATKELVARVNGSEDVLLRDLAAAVVDAIDEAFIDPSNAGDTVTPASILYGAVEVPASGGTSSNAVVDLGDLLDALPGRVDRSVFVTSPTIAARLAMMLPAASISLAPGAEHLLGRPLLLASTAGVAASTSDGGGVIALLDADRVQVSGFDSVRLETSDQGSLVMNDDPSMDSTTPTAAQTVSMWQTGAIGLMARCAVNWRAAAGAAYLSGAEYQA